MTTTSLSTVLSDLESIGTAVTAVTSPLAGITSATTAVSNTVNNILAPLIEDAVSQKYEKAFRLRLQSINDALAQGDNDRRANDLANLVNGLCIAAGYPATGGVGEDISIPVSYLNSLLVIAAAQERSTAYLAALAKK